MKDLVVLAADKNMEQCLQGIQSRPLALGIRQLAPPPTILVHPERDPGCRIHADSFLRLYVNQHQHALVVLDLEGSGHHGTREELEADIEGRLRQAGWEDRAKAIVIDPELEMWIWSESPAVSAALGWKDREPDLRSWLAGQGYLQTDQIKPDRPKEAVERVLREVKMPRSAAIYRKIANEVSLKRCSDEAFGKLRALLQRWFAPNGPSAPLSS